MKWTDLPRQNINQSRGWRHEPLPISALVGLHRLTPNLEMGSLSERTCLLPGDYHVTYSSIQLPKSLTTTSKRLDAIFTFYKDIWTSNVFERLEWPWRSFERLKITQFEGRLLIIVVHCNHVSIISCSCTVSEIYYLITNYKSHDVEWLRSIYANKIADE